MAIDTFKMFTSKSEPERCFRDTSSKVFISITVCKVAEKSFFSMENAFFVF